jgi:hypothetical protein
VFPFDWLTFTFYYVAQITLPSTFSDFVGFGELEGMDRAGIIQSFVWVDARRQKSEVRGQKSEVGGQRTEDRGRRTEDSHGAVRTSVTLLVQNIGNTMLIIVAED